MNEREEKFCREYARTGNAYQSCIAAGYTPITAQKNCTRILKRPEVAKRITEIRMRNNERADKNSVDVVNELSKLAFADALNYIKPDPLNEGQFIYKSPDELTPAERAAVAVVKMHSIQIGKTADGEPIMRQVYNYRLHDKMLALIQMGRHFGLFDDRIKLMGSGRNRFANLSSEQLAELRSKIIGFMTKAGQIQDGEYHESTPAHLLAKDRGHAGPEGH